MAYTFWSKDLDAYQLRRIASEAEKKRIKEIDNISKTEVIGGYKRIIRIEPNIEKLRAYNLDLFRLFKAVESSNLSLNTGTSQRITEYITSLQAVFIKTQTVSELWLWVLTTAKPST